GFLLYLLGLMAALAVVRSAARARLRRHDLRVRRELLRIGGLLVTALAALLLAPVAYLDGLHLVALAALLVTALLAHARSLHDDVARAAVRAAQLEAARQQLTAALLRSSIHPHWLMNTLTALQELIERAPPQASELVHRLADEFRLLRSVSERPTIPAAEEVALCRAHLAIVRLARDLSLDFVIRGEAVLSDVVLPPGVLHTLVENGLTHGALAGAGGGVAASALATFTLSAARLGDSVRLELSAPAGRGGRAARPPGTGTRFIEASLEAAFPGRWTFAHGMDGEAPDARWRSVLTVPAAPQPRHDILPLDATRGTTATPEQTCAS
nr:histidine kinase [Gemmatimonadaceae bacterium]